MRRFILRILKKKEKTNDFPILINEYNITIEPIVFPTFLFFSGATFIRYGSQCS